MTGEITLSGLVLPVGGIREKVLAARRFGIKTVILPALNEPDLTELPEEIRQRHDVRAGRDPRAGHPIALSNVNDRADGSMSPSNGDR